MPESITAMASQPGSERVEQSVENWKRKLLDLSKRNRLLNFKPNKVSTVTVVDELPAEVFRQLYLEGKGMRFRSLPEKTSESAVDPDTLDLEFDEVLKELASAASYEEPADDGRPALRHTDEWLQTNITAERLNHSLRRIADQAELILDEQGVNTLFLSLGMLRFYEAEASADLRRAPLLLLPVQLERSSARSAYVLRPRTQPGCSASCRRSSPGWQGSAMRRHTRSRWVKRVPVRFGRK